MTRSFNIALNLGNGVKVREFKLRSRTQEQAVFGRHLCGCVFARRRVFARLRCSTVCSELLATSGPRWSQLPTSWRPSPKLATHHMRTNIGRRRTSRGLYAARVVATQSDCAKRSKHAFVDKVVAEFTLRFLQSDDLLASVGKQHRATSIRLATLAWLCFPEGSLQWHEGPGISCWRALWRSLFDPT